MTRQLDDIDRTILRSVTADGRQTVRALARAVGLSEPSVRDRLQRLERDGVITGYHANLDPASVDAGTAAFIALRFDPGAAARAVVNERLKQETCVLEVHEVAGEDCYWLKVRVASTDALADALDRIRAIPPVHGTSTTIVLRTVFERPLSADATPSP
ncbi:Lrp/AsnC family transcriptional regulator [Streptomyces sp. NPDC050617]|uniref:Lrp/AsnC family transcriptional regulator n=1 Tax=Streptomyces sp. NPDC050617 TaxID=3154628 RepID=UPI00342F4B24